MRYSLWVLILLGLSASLPQAAEPRHSRFDSASEQTTYEWYDGDRKRQVQLALDQVGVYLDAGRATGFYQEATRALLQQLMPDSTVESMEGRVARLRLSDRHERAAIVSRYGTLEQGGQLGWVDGIFHDRSDVEKRSPFQLTGEMIVHFAEMLTEEAATVWADAFGVDMLHALELDNAYLFSCPPGPACLQLTVRAREDNQVRYAYPNWLRPKVKRNDTLYPDQWHLNNTGQGGGTAGEDARLEGAWNSGYTGAGVRIAIVDDGLEIAHEDLAGNVVAGASYDYVELDTDPTAGDHGTSCAGVAAAVGMNALGVRGAGYGADLVGFRLLGAGTDANEADALTRDAQSVAIYSNSWGPADTGKYLIGPAPLTLAGLEAGVKNGRGGLGNLYIWAGGNGRLAGDNSNYDGYANSRYTIAVGASTNLGVQSWYSEPGANLLVNAPSNGGSLGITTTDRTGSIGGNYTSTFGGTSSATPLVAGVISLVLQANPNLSWRDVKLLLASTAAQNNPADADWTTNAAGLHINHKYGYGRVDAAAAVQAALVWTPVEMEFTTSKSSYPGISISDSPEAETCGPWTTDAMYIEDEISMESVDVYFKSQHSKWGNLEVVLVSPSGTESKLADYHATYVNDYFSSGWTFGVERLFGESSQGTWIIKVRDCEPSNTGSLDHWSVKIYGTKSGVCYEGPRTESSIQYTTDAYIQSEASLSTSGSVSVLANADVTYEAGNTITLMPGFRAFSGSRFHAQTGPVTCP